MEMSDKDYIIRKISEYYSLLDIKSIGRKLEINEQEFYVEGRPTLVSAENLVNRLCQLGKENQLREIIMQDPELKREKFFSDYDNKSYKKDVINNVKAEKFGEFFTTLLQQLDFLEEEEFDEDELIEPIEFEEKMRNKARLNEDIIQAGIAQKNDIISLRRRANALDYKKYEKLLQRIGRIYRTKLCNVFPEDITPSSKRYRELYNLIENSIPIEIKDEYEDVDIYIEGLIYDTIAHCLIFNQ